MNSALKIAIIVILIVDNSQSNLLVSDICGQGLKCVPKCCPDKFYVFCDLDDSCKCEAMVIDSADLSKVPVYNEYLKYTGKNLTDVFSLVKGDLQEESLDSELMDIYLVENGKLHVKLTIPNAPAKSLVFGTENFCVDFVKTEESMHPEITFRITMPPKQDHSAKLKLNTAAYIISSIFLTLVLLVYFMFASLRNLVGKIIMSIAASLLGGFLMFVALLLKILENGDVTDGFCLGSNFCIYFFFLASFFWMNVLSFDIWKQFRKKRLSSYREQRGEYRRKFLTYSIYAWGIPLAMAVIFILLEKNIIDVRSVPSFIKPNIILNQCFLGDTERMYYLYIPMLILILCNWAFYFMTAYAIWQTKRDARTMGVTSTPNNIKERLKIFLRLSLVMGISWVLEIVSASTPDLAI
ncbi:probable G-protein coupled receptor Mth-like 3 isoform X2 [Maniola jurtina]|nr:probable G-protein coupled receptor Mth-like 3 isoform X2 [Maniola jurtina]